MKKFILIAAALLITGYIGAVVGYNIALNEREARTVASVTPPNIEELLDLVNAERAKKGVAPLEIDERLNASAQLKANDEVAYDYFGHVNPHNGKHGYEYIGEVGISCVTGSENLTQNIYVNDAESAVDAWVNSPSHYAAMIDAKYTLTGFGIHENQVVQHFCQVP